MKAIHIGFPKTATTFLQAAVFPRLVDFGFSYFGKDQSARVFASLIDDDDTIFDVAATRERVREAAANTGKALFSYEGLTGHHYRCGFVNRTQIARRLKHVGFDRVVITIRNQFDVLESAYKQYVQSGGVLHFGNYITFDTAKHRYLDPRYFDYAAVYELYAGIFGVDNVLVLQHERLREPVYGAALAQFLEVPTIEVGLPGRPINRSLSYKKTALLRVFNHFTYSAFRPSSLISRRISTALVHRGLSMLPFADGRRSFVGGPVHASIAAFYAESNRRLARAAAISLAQPYPGSGALGR